MHHLFHSLNYFAPKQVFFSSEAVVREDNVIYPKTIAICFSSGSPGRALNFHFDIGTHPKG